MLSSLLAAAALIYAQRAPAGARQRKGSISKRFGIRLGSPPVRLQPHVDARCPAWLTPSHEPGGGSKVWLRDAAFSGLRPLRRKGLRCAPMNAFRLRLHTPFVVFSALVTHQFRRLVTGRMHDL